MPFSFSWLFPGLGTKALGGIAGATGGIMTYHMDLQQYAPIVGIWTSVIEGYDMADESDLKRSAIDKTVILTVLITCIIFFLMGLPMVYKGNGALFIMPGSSPKTHFTQAWNPVRDIELNRLDLYPKGPQLWPWVPMIMDGVIATFIFSIDRPMIVALSCAWVVKSLVFRYGGRKLYRCLMPFFLGFALGELTINFIRPFLKFLFFS